MKLNEILLVFPKLLFILLLSLIFPFIVTKQTAIDFLAKLPDILGILLGGILTSIAFIFGVLNSSELKIIRDNSKNKENQDRYEMFLRNTEMDVKIIFLSFCISIFIVLLYDSKIPVINSLWSLLVLGLFGLFLSVSAIFDVINSVFQLNQLRYELTKKKK